MPIIRLLFSLISLLQLTIASQNQNDDTICNDAQAQDENIKWKWDPTLKSNQCNIQRISRTEVKRLYGDTGLPNLYSYCKKLDLDVIGLMCIPPQDKSADYYFKELNNLNKKLGLNELSMGMSADFIDAVKCSATYLRIGSTIFGKRS